MNKQEFLGQLMTRLSGLPQEDIEERLNFYNEMIDDRVEEGFSEEDAVRQIGNVDDIVSQILAETPFTKLVKERMKPQKQFKSWIILLLILGAPVWLPLLMAAFSIVFALYTAVWSVIISLWAVCASVIGCSLCGILGGLVFAYDRNYLTGFTIIGMGLACAGLSIILFLVSKAATQGIISLTKKIALGIKNCFIKRGKTYA